MTQATKGALLVACSFLVVYVINSSTLKMDYLILPATLGPEVYSASNRN
jgi:hypothetical protein